jgi:hypothetical protein
MNVWLKRGLKEKARDNIAAIRTLKLIEDKSREASRQNNWRRTIQRGHF